MKMVRRGFTLIEVSLFLVITAAVFLGVAVGTQNSIFQQRYNDAVQNYVEFLRTIYSQVTNVQSESNGRTDKLIYGKLVTFGVEENKNVIKTYNVIGDLKNDSTELSNDVLENLANLKANVVVKKVDESGNEVWEPVGFVENYIPRWASQIQTTDHWDDDGVGEDGYKIFKGALLIVRSPSSGSVYTYVMKGKTIDVDGILNDSFANKEKIFEYNDSGTTKNYLLNDFKMEDVNFCVNPNGADRSRLRRDVKIIRGARNASGIEIMPDEESAGNKCEY